MTTVATKREQPIRSTIGDLPDRHRLVGVRLQGGRRDGLLLRHPVHRRQRHRRRVRGRQLGDRRDDAVRYRGRTDIWINGSYWLGSIIGTLAAFLLLNSLPANTGWRSRSATW